MSLFTPISGLVGGALIGTYLLQIQMRFLSVPWDRLFWVVSFIGSSRPFSDICFASFFSCFSPSTTVHTGSSAGVLMLLNGDILGCSGIMSNSMGAPIESMKVRGSLFVAYARW